ncbi:MAG: D-alanyl-D-alanine carboxypeptidase, partial [Patescibacteria group bacterium]|nr:D-alanyl-D-alanine carboxypeptidase [Patescibacteria group bacterium]
LAQMLLSFIGLLSLRAMDTQAQPVMTWQELPLASNAAPNADIPVKKDLNSVGVEVTAKAAAVVDGASGQVLFTKQANEPVPIASLTKLVTAMTFLDEHPPLDKPIEITAEDNHVDGHQYFENGERMTQGQAFQAMLIGSVNAAANALAHANTSRESFIRAMNRKAIALHLRHAHFVDPVGIHPENQASAEDVAMILRAALRYPEIRRTTEQQSFDLPSQIGHAPYHIPSTDLLLHSYLNQGSYRIIAGKTGSLPEAGFCLAQVTQNPEGHRLIVVVLGSVTHFDRFQDNKALTAWAFDTFAWPKRSASAALPGPS